MRRLVAWGTCAAYLPHQNVTVVPGRRSRAGRRKGASCKRHEKAAFKAGRESSSEDSEETENVDRYKTGRRTAATDI